MFLRLFRKSLLKRKIKLCIAILAVVMGAAIPSAMMTVSLDITEKVNYEFRKFGANLLVVPRSDTIDVNIGEVSFGTVTDQRYINETDISRIKSISWGKNVFGYAPFLYQVVYVEKSGMDQRIVLVGTWFDKNTELEDGRLFKTGVRPVNGWWDVKGNWVNDSDELKSLDTCMVGTSVSEKLGLNIGDSLTIKYRDSLEDIENQKTMNLNIVGIISTGSSEDNQIFVPLGVSQTLTERPNKVHTVQVSALCIGCPVDTIAEEIEEVIPYVEAKTIKQLTSAEMSVLKKVEQMMVMVTLIALATTVLGVGTTMTASVIERQKEIGLMKSIGAENRKVAALFLSEAAFIGTAGGILGYLLGFILAQFIGISVFNASISLRLIVFPATIGISLFVTIFASLLPVQRAIGIDPVIVLRGE
ncbi:MAG: ABC transporter permease [Candidatus Hodarchaeota archaeon]